MDNVDYYEVFSLNPEGEMIYHDINSASFSSSYILYHESDISKILQFSADINNYYSNSTQIIRCDYLFKDNPLSAISFSREWYLEYMGIDLNQLKGDNPAPAIVDVIKNSISLGMHEKDVIALIGRPSEYNYPEYVRYDFGATEEYSNRTKGEHVDFNGLIKGEVQCILFVYYDFDLDTVRELSMFYIDGYNIGEYRLLYDGTVKDVKHDLMRG